MLQYKVKPIVNWPGEATPSYQRLESRFKSQWGKTLSLLEREIKHLGGSNVIMQMALREQDIRLDGGIKSNARPSHSGIILTFNSQQGPLSFWSDRYDDWADNVRAIALSLEALRTVDRYGVNKQGSQYAGYKQLAAANENGRKKISTKREAAEWLRANIPAFSSLDPSLLVDNLLIVEPHYKIAAQRLHPDNRDTGDNEKFVELQDVMAVLRGGANAHES